MQLANKVKRIFCRKFGLQFNVKFCYHVYRDLNPWRTAFGFFIIRERTRENMEVFAARHCFVDDACLS